MAFVISLQRANALRDCRSKRRNVDPVKVSCSRDSHGDFSFPPLNRHSRPNFEHFDGSRPLLPPWKPPSVEAEFNYSAKRIASRERDSDKPIRKVVRVASQKCGTLFAEVIQEVDGGEGKIWLRPLLLDNDQDKAGTFVDLRGASDLVLSKTTVAEIDQETKTRIAMNMMATESDVIDRAMSDERWNEVGSRALLAFLRGISEEREK